MDPVRAYLLNAIKSFIGDPPDTSFQSGYLSSLVDVYADNFLTKEERGALRAAYTGKGKPGIAHAEHIMKREGITP